MAFARDRNDQAGLHHLRQRYVAPGRVDGRRGKLGAGQAAHAQITSKRIGQIWLHHSGHDASRSFGTKTREWEMDTVVKLTADDQAIHMEFKKARLRTPENRDQFEPRSIVRDETGWRTIGGKGQPRRRPARATSKTFSAQSSTPMTGSRAQSRPRPVSTVGRSGRFRSTSYATRSSRAASWRPRHRRPFGYGPQAISARQDRTAIRPETAPSGKCGFHMEIGQPVTLAVTMPVTGRDGHGMSLVTARDRDRLSLIGGHVTACRD